MKPTRLLLPLLLCGAFHASATPLNPGQVPQEANWFVHADVDNLRNTSVGELMMTAIEAEHGKQLRAVKRMFSMNPFTDLHGITLWGNGEQNQAVAMIRATFDREHLTDIVGAADEYQTSKHGDNTIHTWKGDEKDGGKIQHGAFFGEDMIIISEQKRLVMQSLDVLNGKSEGASEQPGSGPASFMLGLVNLENLDLRGDEAMLLEKARSLQCRMYEENNRLHAAMTIEATNGQEAKRFGKVLEGIIALGELTSDEIAKLDIRADVSMKDGSKVHAVLSIPSKHILSAMKEAGELSKL